MSSSDRYVLTIEDMKPVDRDAGLVVEVFHLQGQHDQQSHAGGRASAGGSPREIEKRTNRRGETVYVHHVVDEGGYTTASFTVMDAEDLWDSEQAADAIDGLADAWEMAPTGEDPRYGRTDMEPRIEVMSVGAGTDLLVERGFGGRQAREIVESTYAFTMSNDPDLIVFVAGFDRPDPDRDAWMPSGRSGDVSPERYTAAHEYGHIRITRRADDKSAAIAVAAAGIGFDEMSSYGRSDPLEAHAEAFAEWVSTGGSTTNRAVQVYRDEFGWDDILGERPLAASAGEDVELPLVIGEGPNGPVYAYADGRIERPEVDGDSTVEQFHLQGQHDQQSHAGRNADGETIAEVGKTIPEKRDPDDILDEWMSSPEEFAAAQKLAAEKAANVPKPTAEQIEKNRAMLAKSKRPGGWGRGNSYTRRARAQALFEEFGGKPGGSCPCSHCGIKVSPGGEGGFAHLTQDKILTAAEGGTYGTVSKGFPNLIPSCGGCNSSRNQEVYFVRPLWDEEGLAASAGRNTDVTVAEEFVAAEATGKPVGWDTWLEPEVGNTERSGEYITRMVDTWFGPYEQHLIGGEVCDPATIQADGVELAIEPDRWHDMVVWRPESIIGLRFDPNQPRDENGRWAPTGASIAGDVVARVRAGESITVSPSDVAEVVAQFADQEGPIDLAAIDVEGYPNLFAGARANMTAREDMPQIPRAHLKQFREGLEAEGIAVEEVQLNATELSATQRQLDAVKVAGVADAIRNGEFKAGHRIWVSHDNRILDGHHRWAAAAVVELEGHPTSAPLDSYRVDLDMEALLVKARQYNEEHGVAARQYVAHMEALGLTPGQHFHLQGQHDQQSHAGKGASTPVDDYQGGHRPSETGPRIHDLLESEMTDGLDVYQNPHFFTGYAKAELDETMAQLRRVQGDPEANVTIYRAAPEGATINEGDWVSLSETYARLHADGGNAGDTPAVIEMEVPAKTVRWAVDDLMEYGYFPDLGEKRIFSEDDLAAETFHLQGQHDQKSHAGDRAVDATSPAARRGWKPLKGILSERPIEFDDYENRYRVTAANGEQIEARVFATGDDAQVLRSPAWRQRIADGLNGAVDGYDADPTPNAPHVVVVDELPFGLPDAAQDAIAFVASGNRPGPAPEAIPWDASALQGNTITFNATPRGREMWELMEERAAEIMMPAVKSTSVANYTGIHEYGHTRAVMDGIPFINEMYDTIRPLSLSSITPEWKQLSRYGKINPAEAHAETYADWVLSRGVSDNAATQVYAERFRWGQERDQALAAAAGATRLRDQWVWCFDGPKGGILVTKAPEGVDFASEMPGSDPDSPVAATSGELGTKTPGNGSGPHSPATLSGMRRFQFHLQGQHDQQSHAGGSAKAEFEPITAAEARGNSRPVTSEEFQRLAAIGQRQIEEMAADTQPIGLDENWTEIQQGAFDAAQESWGGATIDARTGEFLASDADRYALTVKEPGMETVTVPEGASRAEFDAAMTEARDKFRPVLERRDHYLGVFHDDDLGRIDFDPVTVVDSLDKVETIGAATRAIGGAYNFADGNGYWPPHVDDERAVVASASMGSMEEKTSFKGPAEWKRQAKQLEGAPDAVKTDTPKRRFKDPGQST